MSVRSTKFNRDEDKNCRFCYWGTRSHLPGRNCSAESCRYLGDGHTCELCNPPGPQDPWTRESTYLSSDCLNADPPNDNLDVHVLAQSKSRPHVCPVCTRSFAHELHLVLHTRSHKEYKPYACLCGRSFGRRYALARHQRLLRCNDNHTKI